MPVLHTKSKPIRPTRTIVLSFLLVILVGTALLILPISSREHTFTAPIKALFTATSATCVTGLIVFDTYTHWNLFGQIVILLMIQIGGLGLVTFTSFFNFFLGKKLGLRSMQLASESAGSGGFDDIKKLVANIVRIALAFEAVGALILMTVFVPKYGMQGAYISVFLAVSAFCNAGFDVLGFEGQFSNLVNYADNPVVVLTISLLIICGGLGFVVWNDVGLYRKTKKLILHTKIVLIMTAVLVVFGTFMVMLMEWDNPATMGGMTFFQKLSRSFFQSVTFRTAGFNTMPIDTMYSHTKIFAILLMFIGAAPGSTGGGIKVTTLAVILMTVLSVVQNKSDTIILKRKIDKDVVYKSLSIAVLGAFIVMLTACVLVYTNTPRIGGVNAVFEAVSAFATVGLSVGPTAVVNVGSLLMLIFTMFVGRVGPVSLMISLTLGREAENKNQVIPEGKLFVG